MEKNEFITSFKWVASCSAQQATSIDDKLQMSKLQMHNKVCLCKWQTRCSKCEEAQQGSCTSDNSNYMWQLQITRYI